MTQSRGPVWQCWRRNFTLSAILDLREPVAGKHPRTESYRRDGDKDLNKHTLAEKGREERAMGVHHRYGRLPVTVGLLCNSGRLNVRTTWARRLVPLSKPTDDNWQVIPAREGFAALVTPRPGWSSSSCMSAGRAISSSGSTLARDGDWLVGTRSRTPSCNELPRHPSTSRQGAS